MADLMDRAVLSKYNQLKARNTARDERMNRVSLVRKGDFDAAFPTLFGGLWSKPIVANMVDVAARDTAEMLAPLPAFNCSSPNVASDTSRVKATKRTMIVSDYLVHSKLSVQMYTGADRFVTYGFLPILIEPDFDNMKPRIIIDNPLGAYYEKDRLGNVVLYMRRHEKTLGELRVKFPELAHLFGLDQWNQPLSDESKLEVVYFSDAKRIALFVPSKQGLVLQAATNPLGRCPVVVGERLGLDDDPRGQFDDVIWVQLARARFASLALEAATKAVEAPIALPMDVDELALGPDAVIRSNTPEQIRRVGIEMPASAFSQDQMLAQEVRAGARYPEARSGEVSGSIVTGKGVQALSAGFDSQIKAAQAVFASMFGQIIQMCFELDEKLWPDTEKAIRGTTKGTTYAVKYKPSRDINGEYWVDVQYGMMAGLDPNRALVFGLQARSDKLISRDFLRRQMPWDLNVDVEDQLVQIEDLRDSLQLGLAGLAQALPAFVSQGQNPTEVIEALAKVISARRAGTELEDAVMAAFAPPEEPEPAQEGATPSPLGAVAPDQGAAPSGGGLPPDGLLQGQAPGQQGMPPGGRPDMQMLLAGLSQGGAPQLQANISSRRPF